MIQHPKFSKKYSEVLVVDTSVHYDVMYLSAANESYSVVDRNFMCNSISISNANYGKAFCLLPSCNEKQYLNESC